MTCFDRLKAPQAPPNDAGTHVFAATLPPVLNPAWSVPDWWVNASTGSDTNTCTDSSHPCKSWAQAESRWGITDPALVVAVVAHFVGDDPELLRFRADTSQGGSFTVSVTPTTVSSGALSGVVPKSRVAPGQILNVNLGAAAAGSVGMILGNSTHASNAYVTRVVSGNVVEVTQPFASDDVTEVDTWTNGDSFTVLRPVKLFIGSADTKFIGITSGTTIGPGVWIAPPSGTCQTVLLNVNLLRSRVSCGLVASTISESNSLFDSNVELTGGPNGSFSSLQGGALQGDSFVTSAAGANLDSDLIVNNELHVNTVLAEEHWLALGASSQLRVFGGVVEQVGTLPADPAIFYGAGLINLFGGQLDIDTPAVTSLAGPTITMGGFTVAYAIDATKTPNGGLIPNRAITQANIDLSVAAGGFGGNVLGYDLRSVISSETTPSAPTPLVWGEGNGGTGRDAGCPAGQYLGSEPLACSTPAGTGASSVTGASGVSCSPTTGSIVCSNTGATSVTGAGSTSCSPTTGAITCTTTNSVANGLTGKTSLTTHATLVGEGTSPIAAIGGCSTGVGLVYTSGASSDPACGPLGAAGGGLGSDQSANGALAGCLMYWGGSGVASCQQPGASGLIPQSTSATTWTWLNPPAPSTNSAFSEQNTGSIGVGSSFSPMTTVSVTVALGQVVLVDGAVYFASAAVSGNTYEVACFVDGVQQGNNLPVGPVTTINTTVAAPVTKRISGLSAGAHTVALEGEKFGTGSDTMGGWLRASVVQN